ncbi:polyenoic fatty acid isomerase-like [Actinia tenebrosa]|uniref:Polyenoic fatty acid isomerase-like n=1 Tax=Actinia tenebrosa TaxID=6105 RepID=A0A6P8INM7_ACTTE|nr:polyenoic fatty acid isomerase-like [Actinia tenebrosa]
MVKMGTIAAAILLLSASVILTDANLSKLPLAMQIAFRKLQLLVHNDDKPKGTPFSPLSAKPDPSQRIAIVGAGLAGLHMGYLLKKKGFNNTVVFEKDSRVGGKVMSVWHDGIPHELGACYTSPDYITNVYALAKELGVDDFVPLSPSTAWLDNLPYPLTFRGYVILEVKRLTNAKDPVEAVGNLIKATYRYSVLHRQMFGKYEGELMYKPSSQVLSQLNSTFMAFLEKNRLLALVPVLTASHTMQGYGHLDRVPALYGMLWDTPKFLYAMLARSLGVSGGGVDMFRNGFQQMTDKLAAFSDVHLNIAIENIKRDSTGVTIKFNDGKDRTEKFDFLIWAADTREALRVLEHTTPLEEEFSHLRNTWFTTTLFDSKEQCRSYTPIDYWLSNLYNKREQSVWARRNSRYVLKGGHCPTTKGLKSNISTVAYQMGDHSPMGTSLLCETFNQHFKRHLGVDTISVIKSKSWNYFPRFSVEKTAEGILWKIIENQGNEKTWYIGSSVIFESTKSVLEYNRLMMRRMEM